ncbi:UPF0246 protein YaaA [Salmonella enterica subsp. arizonae]|nr:UPF0246 protein YaaA [Salmonella enterica subsp. arizonae]
MLILISPAKTLDYQSPLATTRYTQPELLDHSQQLIHQARQLSAPQIARLMGISDKLADLNATRFHDWQPHFTPDNARQAILAFKGDVYTGLQAETFSDADFDFAQQHLRMLSGLYGLLRPLDLMQPYRLEMGIRLENPRGKDLYQFWGDIITDKLNETLASQGDRVVINLASEEYFKSVKPKKLNAELIKPVFLDEKNGKFKVISFYAKKARGLMSRFIIENRLTKPEQLTAFNSEGISLMKKSPHKTSWYLNATSSNNIARWRLRLIQPTDRCHQAR